MNYIKLIIEKLKKLTNTKNYKQLGTILNTKETTIRNWVAQDRINYKLIIDYALQHNFDLNYLFNHSIPLDSDNQLPTYIITTIDPELDTLYKEAIATLGDEELKELLKQKILQSILEKIFSNNKSLKELFYSILSPKQHIVLLLYLLAKELSKKDINDINDPKAYLIQSIENFEPEDKRALLTKLDKIKLITKIEKLNDEEARLLLKHIEDALPLLEEEMSLINKLTFS